MMPKPSYVIIVIFQFKPEIQFLEIYLWMMFQVPLFHNELLQ
jgi:hypothetical protein